LDNRVQRDSGPEKGEVGGSSFRKALGINIGDEVILRMEDDELRITTLKRRVERAQRLVRKHVKRGTSLVDELIAERREAARNE